MTTTESDPRVGTIPAAASAILVEPASTPRSTSSVIFTESLRGFVTSMDPVAAIPAPVDDRIECVIAVESLIVAEDSDDLRVCVLERLTIAVDTAIEPPDGGLRGVIRSGRVLIEGLAPLRVEHGEFELFPRVPGDARRMRYRLYLRDADGARWFLRGTKLVVNEAPRAFPRRVWIETTTLYIMVFPMPDGSSEEDAEPPMVRASTGVVRVLPVDFVRQLGSVRGEPGPGGGLTAVYRLARVFRSIVAEVYRGQASRAEFAPGIESAFSTHR